MQFYTYLLEEKKIYENNAKQKERIFSMKNDPHESSHSLFSNQSLSTWNPTNTTQKEYHNTRIFQHTENKEKKNQIRHEIPEHEQTRSDSRTIPLVSSMP